MSSNASSGGLASHRAKASLRVAAGPITSCPAPSRLSVSIRAISASSSTIRMGIVLAPTLGGSLRVGGERGAGPFLLTDSNTGLPAPAAACCNHPWLEVAEGIGRDPLEDAPAVVRTSQIARTGPARGCLRE